MASRRTCGSSTTADEDGLYLHYYDATHPGAREFIWERVREGYYRHGIDVFWLDACEPEMLPMAPDNLRFHAGQRARGRATSTRVTTPRAFFEGMRAAGQDELLLLCRSAWAGSQRYGAAVWSADIDSTFASLRSQVRAGLNMGVSGIPWWTHDIGGFRGGDPSDAEFRELVVRWFQFGALLAHLPDARAPAAGGGRLRGRSERGLVVRGRGVRASSATTSDCGSGFARM